MFTLSQSPSYWWSLTLKLPSSSGGVKEMDDHHLEVEFNRLDEEQFEALCASIDAEKPKDRDLALRLVRSFRHGMNKAPKVAYAGPEDVAALMRLPGAGSAVVAAFFDSRAAAARKN